MSYYGTCLGGPCHGRKLAHVPDTYRLCYQRSDPNRSFPAVQATSDPDFTFGLYIFDHQGEIWRWHADVDNR